MRIGRGVHQRAGLGGGGMRVSEQGWEEEDEGLRAGLGGGGMRVSEQGWEDEG